MSEDGTVQRASIATVDARVARLEQQQIEQAGEMQLIKLEQQHLREIMTSRFVSLEVLMQAQGTKLDTFIGKIESLIAEGLRQQADLEASPLGRQIDERLKRNEQWVEVSKEFHAEQRGMRKVVTGLVGTNALGVVVALVALLKALNIL